jgi:hypothetical protein
MRGGQEALKVPLLKATVYTQLLLSLAVSDTTLSRQGFEMSEVFINSFKLLIMVDGKSRIKKINFRFFPSFDFQLDLCVHGSLKKGGDKSVPSLPSKRRKALKVGLLKGDLGGSRLDCESS